jgi:hypothetical protein
LPHQTKLLRIPSIWRTISARKILAQEHLFVEEERQSKYTSEDASAMNSLLATEGGTRLVLFMNWWGQKISYLLTTTPIYQQINRLVESDGGWAD